MQSLFGLHEIHITVEHTNGGFILLDDFVRTHNGFKKIFAVSALGDTPDQWMISKWESQVTSEEATKRAKKYADDMTNAGMKVLRTKVEIMMNSVGVPQTDEEYEKVCDHLGWRPYFEFHTKITDGYNGFWNLQNALSSGGVSISLTGSQVPLATLRVYNMGKVKAEERHKVWIQEIIDNGYEVGSSAREFAVYDDFPTMDIGLFE